MTETTVTRADLSEAVYQEVGLSRNDSAALVETVLNEIVEALTRGQTVKISSFGSFSVRQKGKRVGRNPKTGEEVPILPRKVLVFRASHVLKNKINRALGKSGGRAASSSAPASAAAEPKA
jgi:integration host factor subunit alpha